MFRNTGNGSARGTVLIMNKETKEAAIRSAERLAVRELADSIRLQNIMLAWVGCLFTLGFLFLAWLFVRLDSMNVLTRLLM